LNNSVFIRDLLQTSDLGTITLGGVVQRLGAESGSAPGAGLQFARVDVKGEVDRQLSLSACKPGLFTMVRLSVCTCCMAEALDAAVELAGGFATVHPCAYRQQHPDVPAVEQCCEVHKLRCIPHSLRAGAQGAQLASSGKEPAPAAAAQAALSADGE
jgi:hypothetical protein